MKKLSNKKMNKTFRDNLITYGMVIAAYVIMQILVSAGVVSSLLQGLLVPLCTYAILAVSLNLTVGILGELSLGHAGFMCIGAFTSAFFSKVMENTAMPSGLRYLAIVTLAFGEIIKNLVNILFVGLDENGFHISFTNTMDLNMAEDGQVIIKGAQGITGTPHDSNFTIGIVLLLVTLFIVLNLIHSRDGRAIMAIRDNTIAAESVGIHITKYKLMAFSISAALAGVAGVLYAHNLSTLTALPKNFGYNMSIMILVFVVLGGIGNIRGSIIASVILTLLPELLRGLNDYRMLIYSIVLIVMMLFNWAPKCIEWREKVAAGFKSKKSVKKEAE